MVAGVTNDGRLAGVSHDNLLERVYCFKDGNRRTETRPQLVVLAIVAPSLHVSVP
jgi:hypothetical protein